MSSSWGNGHATLWRGLCRALSDRGHELVFFEKDVAYYAAHRDMAEVPGVALVLYASWQDVSPLVRRHLADADIGMVTSYCPDALMAAEALLDSRASLKTFYDLDTPVTLERLGRGERVEYIPSYGLKHFDLVLSYTGGEALHQLAALLGARKVASIYGSVDPRVHARTGLVPELASDLSYIGTYAADRQEALDSLFLQPARRLSGRRFFLAGSQYPADFPWRANIHHRPHLPPSEHSAFYSSSRLTLNVTRQAMVRMGYCPSGRLFEAAACGAPILSDAWEGLDDFYTPGREILIARTTEEAVAAMQLSDAELQAIAKAARERTLACHTASHRALELERVLENAKSQETQWKTKSPFGVSSPQPGPEAEFNPSLFPRSCFPSEAGSTKEWKDRKR